MCSQRFSHWAKLSACVSPRKYLPLHPCPGVKGPLLACEHNGRIRQLSTTLLKFFRRALPLGAHSRNRSKRRSVFTLPSLFDVPLFNFGSLECASRQVNLFWVLRSEQLRLVCLGVHLNDSCSTSNSAFNLSWPGTNEGVCWHERLMELLDVQLAKQNISHHCWTNFDAKFSTFFPTIMVCKKHRVISLVSALHTLL